MVVLRIAPLLAMTVMFAMAMTVSQVFIYQSNLGICNTENMTLALNVTANVTSTSAQSTCTVHQLAHCTFSYSVCIISGCMHCH